MLDQSTVVVDCLEDSLNDGLFSSLIEVLSKELIIYEELKEFLIHEKQMLLKATSLDHIHESNALKENIILKSRILEEARFNIIKKIARNLDIDENELKLSLLARHADEEKRDTIENLKEKLLEIAENISTINDKNKYLLSISMNNVKGTLDFISSLINRSGVYLGNGEIDEIRKNGRLIRTEG